MPFHPLGVDFPSQTASHELLSSFQVYHFKLILKEQMWKALKSLENSLDQSSRMWHLIISWRDGLL